MISLKSGKQLSIDDFMLIYDFMFSRGLDEKDITEMIEIINIAKYLSKRMR